MGMSSAEQRRLVPHQRLATSGARAVLPYSIDGALYLAVPQMARDIPGQTPQMNLGDSDIDMPIYRWRDGRFEAHASLAVPGGEDAEFFRIGPDAYLATASIRTGSGPYELNAESRIFRWRDGAWAPFQNVPTFAAKQWKHFSFEGRHFLALAQGVAIEGAQPRHPRHSCIFEWDGARFAPFQTLDGPWGYNWAYFEAAGARFLAYADHAAPSLLYRWNGSRFAPDQAFAPKGGRAFAPFVAEGQTYLAFANLIGESTLYRRDGGAFVPHQTLGGPGGREFALFEAAGALWLIRIRFIEGTPAAPKPDLASQLYRWERGRFAMVEEFATHGGTDAHAFAADGALYVAVSNSLGPEIRFRADTAIYRFAA